MEDDKMKIDILNRKLYEKKQLQTHKRRRLHKERIKIAEDFKDGEFEELKKRKTSYSLPSSVFKRIFLITFILFIIAVATTFVKFYRGGERVSNDLISMELVGQPFIDAGEPLRLVVRIQNFNEVPLQIPDLVISYPIDSESGEEKVIRRSLPELKKGARAEEEFKIPLVGQEGEQRKVTATLEYHIPGSSSIFTKSVSENVIIRSTPTRVTIDAPEKVIHNQDVMFDIRVGANTTESLRNILVRIELPPDFEFIGANREALFGNEVWSIPKLSPQNEFRLRIKAKVHSLPGESRSIHVYVGQQKEDSPTEIKTTFNHAIHTFEVEQPFLETRIFVDGKRASAIPVEGDTDVSIEIDFKNTLEEAIKNVRLSLYLDGNIYIPQSVRVLNAEYNSLARYILWSEDTYERLKELKPEQEGSVQFTFNTKPFLSSEIPKNPKLHMWVSATALGENGKEYNVKQIDSTELRGISELSVSAFSQYSSGPFKNLGPYPPKAGRKTSYTLTFQIRNHPNDVEDVILSTILPSYVRPTGKVSPSTESKNIHYVASTGEFTWKIPKIPAGTGVGRPAKELSIQVEATPSISHIGELLQLTRKIDVTAHDPFANVDITYHASPINSHVRDAGNQGGLVKE